MTFSNDTNRFNNHSILLFLRFRARHHHTPPAMLLSKLSQRQIPSTALRLNSSFPFLSFPFLSSQARTKRTQVDPGLLQQ